MERHSTDLESESCQKEHKAKDQTRWQMRLGLDKNADFLGREALRRIKAEGVKRKLVGIEVDGAKVGTWISHYWLAQANGRRIGHVTSLTYSPRLKKNIGYALLSSDHAKLGTKFRVTSPWGDRTATVVRKPFVDPKKEIPKS